jgi:hypothetical protein
MMLEAAMKRPVAFALTVLVILGCGSSVPRSMSPPPGARPIWHPALRIVVQQELGSVAFEFFVEKEPQSGVFVRSSAISLAVKRPDTHESLWEIRSPVPRGADRIAYGLVPDGFEQDVPKMGPPPPLVPGTLYSAGARAGAPGVATFVYEGRR